MKILITGITGFVGTHLAEYLEANGHHDIHGIVRKKSENKNILKRVKKNFSQSRVYDFSTNVT